MSWKSHLDRARGHCLAIRDVKITQQKGRVDVCMAAEDVPGSYNHYSQVVGTRFDDEPPRRKLERFSPNTSNVPISATASSPCGMVSRSAETNWRFCGRGLFEGAYDGVVPSCRMYRVIGPVSGYENASPLIPACTELWHLSIRDSIFGLKIAMVKLLTVFPMKERSAFQVGWDPVARSSHFQNQTLLWLGGSR